MTCDDFRAAMADANEHQSRPVRLVVQPGGHARFGSAKPSEKQYFRVDHQTNHAAHARYGGQTADDDSRQNRAAEPHNGEAAASDYQGKRATEAILLLTEAEQIFLLQSVTEAVVPSLLRGFSAPVHRKLSVQRRRPAASARP